MSVASDKLGAWGELQACFYLTNHDYNIRERNWRAGHLEIDIIAEELGQLIFVEVKTRSYEFMHTAFEAVDAAKKQHIINAAQSYMRSKYLDMPFRFDIITVVGDGAGFELTHYADVFNRRTKHTYKLDDKW